VKWLLLAWLAAGSGVTTHARGAFLRRSRRRSVSDPGRQYGVTRPTNDGAPERLIGNGTDPVDPMLELREFSQRLGIWKGIDPDEYVASLREGWN
jgi:hypothetical protein